MKVRVTLTLDVDTAQWAEGYGTTNADIRRDVREYVTNAVDSSEAALDGLFTLATVTA